MRNSSKLTRLSIGVGRCQASTSGSCGLARVGRPPRGTCFPGNPLLLAEQRADRAFLAQQQGGVQHTLEVFGGFEVKGVAVLIVVLGEVAELFVERIQDLIGGEGFAYTGVTALKNPWICCEQEYSPSHKILWQAHAYH